MFAWSFLMIGLGLFSLLDRNSGTALWAGFEIISSVGSGVLSVTLLPAVQAALDEKHVATATGMYSFARGFGSIWDVTIPGVIFGNQVKIHAHTITDAGIADQLASGQAYQLATKAFLDTIEDETVRNQVISVFSSSMKIVWYAAVAVAGLGFLVTFVQKEIKLRQELNTEFGLEEEENREADRHGEARTTGHDVELEDLQISSRAR